MIEYAVAFVLALACGLVIGYPILLLCRRLKFKQTILHYVDMHSGKSGTPTMGGIIFVLACIFGTSFLLDRQNFFLPLFALIVMLFYGGLGFLDDFIKVKFHQNEGLKPYQKIIGQVGISLIVGLFVYFKLGSNLIIFGLDFDIGIFVIPFVMLFYVAVTNSVNLLDGLDGLCAGVSSVYLFFFALCLTVIGGIGGVMAIPCFAMVGGLVAFLAFNGFPAKIFMGDTGSLALGGFVASVAVISKTELLLPLIGLLYVLTALSDIMQVFYFKKTHKRIFKMAPLHHHFEQCGVHENKIVTIYIIITFVLGTLCLLGQLIC